MKIFTKIYLQSLIALLIFCNSFAKDSQEPIHQHNSTPIQVPSIVDGTPFGINGHEIKKMIYIIREVEKLCFGIQDHTTKVRKGQYTFQGMPHCVASLAEYEAENDPSLPYVQQELNVILKQAITDFIKIATPFVEQARGVKAVTLNFMKEWAEKHEREGSSILNWAKEKDGHEFDTFRQDVTCFEKLYNFCQDLISFTSDLIQSCPRGWQQFLELQKKK